MDLDASALRRVKADAGMPEEGNEPMEHDRNVAPEVQMRRPLDEQIRDLRRVVLGIVEKGVSQ